MKNNPSGHSVDPIEDTRQFVLLIRCVVWTAAPYDGAITVTFPEIPHFETPDAALSMHVEGVDTLAVMKHFCDSIDDSRVDTLLPELFDTLADTTMLGYDGDLVIRLHAARDREAVTMRRGRTIYYIEFGETCARYQSTHRYIANNRSSCRYFKE